MIVKYCECGCGVIVNIGKRFIHGHNRKGKFKPKSEPQLFECECGCGEIVNPGRRFIIGHNHRKPKPEPQLCKCGCGEYTEPGNKFINGHNWLGKQREMTDIHRENLSNSHVKTYQNERWNAQIDNFINGKSIIDFISPIGNRYGITERDYNEWRYAVYERDDYICQICGARYCMIHAHHIRKQSLYPDLILDINNGITMCRKCHELTYGKEEIYSEELQMTVDGII